VNDSASRTGPARLARSAGATVFGTDAAGYHAARIGYPAELYEAIAQRGGTVAELLEIGPGTGLATEALLERFSPWRYVAVEVDKGMAEHLRARISNPALQVVTGSFIDAPVGGRFDLAACAAAFHWLPPEPALARLRGLLRSGGILALWWNSYRQAGIGDPFAEAVIPLLADIELPPSEGPTGHYSLDVDLHRQALGTAGFVGFEPLLFRRERTLTPVEVRRLYATYSYVRVLPPERRDALLDDIQALAARFGQKVPNVTLTALYLATNP